MLPLINFNYLIKLPNELLSKLVEFRDISGCSFEVVISTKSLQFFAYFLMELNICDDIYLGILLISMEIVN